MPDRRCLAFAQSAIVKEMVPAPPVHELALDECSLQTIFFSTVVFAKTAAFCECVVGFRKFRMGASIAGRRQCKAGGR